jgi:DNA-binding transcriptional ArsR family regulator
VTTYEVDGWTALGDRTRRAIFARLALEPSAVGDLAATLPVTRPAVSQHLKVLKDAGLITDERVGTRRVYRVEPAGLERMRAELDAFWTATLSAYKRVVEAPDLPAHQPSTPSQAEESRHDTHHRTDD